MNYTMILKLVLPVIHEVTLSKMEVPSQRKRQEPHVDPTTVVILSFLPECCKEIFKGKIRKLACQTNEVHVAF